MNFLKIERAKSALISLSQQKISVSSAVALARLIKKCDEEIEIFRKQRNDIFCRYGKINEEKGIVEFESEEKSDECAQALNELNNIEIEGIVPVKIKDEVSISAVDVINLDGLVEFEEVDDGI